MTDEAKDAKQTQSKRKGRPGNRWYLVETTEDDKILILLGPIGSKNMLIDEMTPEQKMDALAGGLQIKRGYLEDDPIKLA